MNGNGAGSQVVEFRKRQSRSRPKDRRQVAGLSASADDSEAIHGHCDARLVADAGNPAVAGLDGAGAVCVYRGDSGPVAGFGPGQAVPVASDAHRV